MSLLEVKGLTTAFKTGRGEVTAIEDVSFTLSEREILGIVGEFGQRQECDGAHHHGPPAEPAGARRGR